ncbi:TOBE domain-containing protein (plasmid) [Neorhizobium galegae]|nr:TOBE domain-containing protein [Neorhizobium galegae]
MGSTVKLMIRPHRLVLADSAGQPNSFTGTVEHIVYRGQILTLNIRCGGRLLQADLPTHAGVLPEKGDEVTLAVAAQDVTLVGQVAP